MRRKLLFIIAAILALVNCDPFGNCGIEESVGIALVLDMTAVTKPIEDVHIYAFDASDRMDLHNYYASEAELNSDILYIDHGDYAVIAVLNVGKDFSPMQESRASAVLHDIMLADFIAWLKKVEPLYPNMMVGMNRGVTTDHGTLRIIIDVDEGTTNLQSNILRLNITVPQETMPDYVGPASTSRSQVADHHLRAVAEVYKKGTSLRVHSYSETLTNSILDLHLQPGEYDVLLWTDHVPVGTDDDHHYLTSSLREVSFAEHMEYMAGLDSRQAHSVKVGALVTEGPVTHVSAELNRVLAKYRLVAIDVEKYKTFIQINKYPPIDKLDVNVSYNGYFPNSHDVHTDKPNSSGAGVQFDSTLKDITDKTTLIGSDYIFAANLSSGEDPPYVDATVTITNRETEKVITRKIVRIDYKRGHVTTVESDFLTAGIVDQGISIDTNWDGVIDVYF